MQIGRNPHELGRVAQRFYLLIDQIYEVGLLRDVLFYEAQCLGEKLFCLLHLHACALGVEFRG